MCLCCEFCFVRCLDPTSSMKIDNPQHPTELGSHIYPRGVCSLKDQKGILSVLCLEAAPMSSPFPRKVISTFQLDAFPGPASWSELLWAKFGPLTQRQLIHPLFFLYSSWFPTTSPDVWKSRQILLQFTAKESCTKSVYSSTKKYVPRRHTQERAGSLRTLTSCSK